MVPSPSLSNKEKASLNSATCSSVKPGREEEEQRSKKGWKREQKKGRKENKKNKEQKNGKKGKKEGKPTLGGVILGGFVRHFV
jgi:hypothetical protein